MKVPSIEAAEIQGRESNTGHHLPHGVEGSEVRIKDMSATGFETSKIRDGNWYYKYLNLIFTSFIFLNINVLSLPILYITLPHVSWLRSIKNFENSLRNKGKYIKPERSFTNYFLLFIFCIFPPLRELRMGKVTGMVSPSGEKRRGSSLKRWPWNLKNIILMIGMTIMMILYRLMMMLSLRESNISSKICF